MLNFSSLGTTPNILNSNDGTVLKYSFDTYVPTDNVYRLEYPYVLLLENKNNNVILNHKYYDISPLNYQVSYELVSSQYLKLTKYNTSEFYSYVSYYVECL